VGKAGLACVPVTSSQSLGCIAVQQDSQEVHGLLYSSSAKRLNAVERCTCQTRFAQMLGCSACQPCCSVPAAEHAWYIVPSSMHVTLHPRCSH
jgi:hypothetical protein